MATNLLQYLVHFVLGASVFFPAKHLKGFFSKYGKAQIIGFVPESHHLKKAEVGHRVAGTLIKVLKNEVVGGAVVPERATEIIDRHSATGLPDLKLAFVVPEVAEHCAQTLLIRQRNLVLTVYPRNSKLFIERVDDIDREIQISALLLKFPPQPVVHGQLADKRLQSGIELAATMPAIVEIAPVSVETPFVMVISGQ
jgi:hypothetical protein